MAAEILECIREDDFVEYFLFINGIEDDINANEETKLVWDSKLLCIRSLIAKYTDDYIWNKDVFNVALRDGSHGALVGDSETFDKGTPPHLYGITHYGDNIEDEWFIVYLLLQLTKEVDGLVVRVADSDGEFLLIEAAEHLPSWASPELCERRVFLYHGAVHMLAPEKQELTIQMAVAKIRNSPSRTVATEQIQQAILARIEGYPDKAVQLQHRTNAYVPVAVAALLKEKPQLVAAAVHAFCNRDPIDMKACRAMRYFPPESCVTSSVKMTRCLYAMLTHNKYTPDRRTGWTVPPANTNQHRAFNIGVKLACGFEILVTEAKQTNSEKGWQRYLASLKKRGYFMDLLEGSKDYNVLLDRAKDYYESNVSTLEEKSTSGQDIVGLMAGLDYDVNQMRQMEACLPPPDDDAWLELEPADLDAMLEQRYGGRHNVNNAGVAADDISSQLNRFLEHVSEVDGAEFPPPAPPQVQGDAPPPMRPKRGVKKKAAAEANAMTNSMMTNSIAFDSDAFSCAVQNILDFVVPEDKWGSDDSDMSSYEDETDMDLDHLRDKQQPTGDEQPARRPSDDELKQYMDQMDRELAKTTLGQSFHRQRRRSEDFDDVEDFRPVDVDMNALQNVLESYQAQMGGAGPAGNILGAMGVRLDPLLGQRRSAGEEQED